MNFDRTDQGKQILFEQHTLARWRVTIGLCGPELVGQGTMVLISASASKAEVLGEHGRGGLAYLTQAKLASNYLACFVAGAGFHRRSQPCGLLQPDCNVQWLHATADGRQQQLNHGQLQLLQLLRPPVRCLQPHRQRLHDLRVRQRSGGTAAWGRVCRRPRLHGCGAAVLRQGRGKGRLGEPPGDG